MYYRILNELDVNMLERCEIVNQVIMARVREIIETLGQAYGYNRGSKDMGGYALVFTSYVEYTENIEDILSFYKLDNDLSEYQDVIVSIEKDIERTQWVEQLFMLSSDDALVIIYPMIESKGD